MPASPAVGLAAPAVSPAAPATSTASAPAARSTAATAPSSPPRGLSFPAFVPAAPPASPAPAAPATAAVRDDPKLPITPERYDENELRAAVGASPRADGAAGQASSGDPGDHDADDATGELRPRRSPRKIAVAALGILAAAGVGALVVLGSVNRDRYVLTCEPERAVPEQGRGFPPWGTRALPGEAWRPLKIARETRCQPLETDDPLVLERAYLAMVLEQATALVTAREVTRLDDAEALLKQALLLTRPPEHEPEPLARQRGERHQEVEHMLGDVTYGRATARLHDAAAALGDAARQFDAAVAQHPAHASDAGAWAAYARRLAQELHAGPAGEMRSVAAGPAAPPPPSAAPTAPSSASAPSAQAGSGEANDHPGVPLGTVLPVEPDPGSGAPPAAAPAAPPDAGPPTGGVLL